MLNVEALDGWTTRWILRFHPGKCHVLTLGKFDNIKHAHSYKVGNKVLDHVFSEKDLGVIFDSDLSFEEHIFNQVKKSKFNGWFNQKKLFPSYSRSFPSIVHNICQTPSRVRTSDMVSKITETFQATRRRPKKSYTDR